MWPMGLLLIRWRGASASLLPSLLTSYFLVFFLHLSHTDPPLYNSIDFFAGEGVKASVFSFHPITPAFLSITLLPPPVNFLLYPAEN